MNEYIVQIISATRLWLISRYSHHTLKKRRKMTAKSGHPCTEWFSSLYLQTNCKHMENQSLFCTRKTSFYMDNITSTLTIVVFQSVDHECLPCMFVRCVANWNWKLWTTEKWQHRFGITGNIACIPIHAFALHSDTCLFFQRSFARNLKNISPIVWYCCHIWRPYKRYLIFCTKQTRKQSLFYQHPEHHVTFPECIHFPDLIVNYLDKIRSFWFVFVRLI